MKPLTKLKKHAQRSAGDGWRQHVNKYVKRTANRVIRRVLRQEAQEWD